MERKIRVAAVSYLNTKPLIRGFEQGMMSDRIELVTDYPARIADMLIHGDVDISLVPVATIPLLREHYIITDYCIGAEGNVASVCLFSDVPFEEITEILMDYQSRSSAGLLKVLLRDHWKKNIPLIASEAGYEKNIKGKTAGLVIGDRALQQRAVNKYIYDLATEWKNMTGLPFVFAAWIANKELPEDFIRDFNEATAAGLSHLPEIIAANPYPHYDLMTYYTENISYELTDKKRIALAEYLNRLEAPL